MRHVLSAERKGNISQHPDQRDGDDEQDPKEPLPLIKGLSENAGDGAAQHDKPQNNRTPLNLGVKSGGTKVKLVKNMRHTDSNCFRLGYSGELPTHAIKTIHINDNPKRTGYLVLSSVVPSSMMFSFDNARALAEMDSMSAVFPCSFKCAA